MREVTLETITDAQSWYDSMDAILSVQNKDFTGDGKEFTEIPRARDSRGTEKTAANHNLESLLTLFLRLMPKYMENASRNWQNFLNKRN